MRRYLTAFAILTSFLAGEAHADPTLDAIVERGKITVATEAAFKPFEFVEDGKIVGFGSDLLAQVAKDLEVEVEQLDLPFQGILAGLAAGQYDIVATSVAINPERAMRYAYTRPFATIENAVVTAVGDDRIKQASDLNGVVVGSQLGSSTEAVARELDEALKADGGSGYSDLRLYQTFPDTAFALRSGQVDAIIIGSTTAGEFMSASPDTFQVVDTVGDAVHLSWVVRPDAPDLLERVNSTITRLVESGELAEMQRKWVGIEMPTPADGYLPEGAIQLQ